MRWPRITLATKYRFLFGAAVVLIIGATLAVPFYTVELLVLQQPFREAQRVVESCFRHTLPNPGIGPGVHGGRYSIIPDDVMDNVRFTRLDPTAATQPTTRPGDEDAFLRQAIAAFRARPDKEFFYRTVVTDRGWEFRYAHAVWVKRSCLNCHDVGRGAPPYRENQLAGVLSVDLPASQSGRFSLVNRAVLVAAGVLAGILAILVFYVITTRFILAPVH